MRRKMAMREMAQDWATMLNHSPQALLYALGKNAGVKYEDSMQGITNIAVPNFDGSMRHVGNVHELIDWISEVRGETVKDPEIQDEFRRQGWGDFESVEGKNGVVMDRLKACSKSKSSEEDEYQQ
jgi:hypothetical protein